MKLPLSRLKDHEVVSLSLDSHYLTSFTHNSVTLWVKLMGLHYG